MRQTGHQKERTRSQKRHCLATCHTCSVSSLAISSGGQLISGSYDSTIKAWNFAARSCVKTISNRKNTITRIAISHNDILIAGSTSASWTCTICGAARLSEACVVKTVLPLLWWWTNWMANWLAEPTKEQFTYGTFMLQDFCVLYYYWQSWSGK